MDPKGAAMAAKMLGLKAVIPMHYGTFVPPLVGTPEELKTHLGDEIEVRALEPGQSTEFN